MISAQERQQYRTNWFFADMRDIDKHVYDIITDFMHETTAFRHKELWAKYFAFLYVAGARRNEPFISQPFIARVPGKKDMYKIIRVNEKHFVGRKMKLERRPDGKIIRKPVIETHYKPHRDILTATFYAWNSHEKALFEFLLGSPSTLEKNLDFMPLIQTRLPHTEAVMALREETYSGKNRFVERVGANISNRFSRLFHTDISNGRKTRFATGLTPHMLRHVRAYNLMVEKNIEDFMVQRLIGWDSKEMVDYYADIKNAMKEKDQVAYYENMLRRLNIPFTSETDSSFQFDTQ